MTGSPTVLVTGATGFVGRYLCQEFIAQGYHVRGTYRRSSPILEELPDVEWIRITDIGPNTIWSESLDSVQYVVHLAALAHQVGKKGKGRFDEFMRVNAEGTRRLAEQCKFARTVQRLIYVSSIGAVRSLSAQRITEATPCQPDTDYGKSKLAGEVAIQEVLREDKPDWCVLRPTLVYGPGNPGNLARLLKLVNTGLPLPLASINNKRSFIFVGNLVDAIAAVLTHPAASRRIFIVSDGQDVSTPELVHILADRAGFPARLVPLPISVLRLIGKVGDSLERFLGLSTGLDTYSVERLIGSLIVDPTAIMNEIDWSPPSTFRQGLELTFCEKTELDR